MIYRLHFDRPLGDPNRPRCHASHYIGWCPDGEVMRRFGEHVAGRGAAIVAAAVAAGIRVRLVWIAPGDRHDERRAKVRGHHADYCPMCRPSSPAPVGG